MHVSPAWSLGLALLGGLLASPARADEPQRQGQTLALATDGPFRGPAFFVIRSPAELQRAFQGRPPCQVDFARGPVVLFAWRPGGKVPLIVGLQRFAARTDVRIKPTQAALLRGRWTASGDGAPYHMVQLSGVAADTRLRPAVAQRATFCATLHADEERAWLQQLHRYQGRGLVQIQAVHGQSVTVSPTNRPWLSAGVPAAWLHTRGTPRPGAHAVVSVPAGEALDFPGYRLQPTDAALLARLVQAGVGEQVLRVRGDVYVADDYPDQGVEVQAIERLSAGEEPEVLGQRQIDEAARVARTLEVVFPVEGSDDPPAEQPAPAPAGGRGFTDSLSAVSGE